jgi:hypothetical protein
VGSPGRRGPQRRAGRGEGVSGTRRPEGPPGAPGDDEQAPAEREDADEVELSSEESFPASDPPSWIGTRGG